MVDPLPPSPPAPLAKKREPTLFDQLVQRIRDVAKDVTSYGFTAAGIGDPIHQGGYARAISTAELTAPGYLAAGLPPDVTRTPSTQVRPEVLVRPSPPAGPTAWDRLDEDTQAAARVVQELEEFAGGPVELEDAWERQGYHFKVSRVVGAERATVIPVAQYNTTITLAGPELARYFVDPAWVAYLVQAEAGQEAVMVVRAGFLAQQCQGLRVAPDTRAELLRIIDAFLVIRQRAPGVPLRLAITTPLDVNFQVILNLLGEFADEPVEGALPQLAEVWRKDPETGEWWQEIGAPPEEKEGAPAEGAPGGETPPGEPPAGGQPSEAPPAEGQPAEGQPAGNQNQT